MYIIEYLQDDEPVCVFLETESLYVATERALHICETLADIHIVLKNKETGHIIINSKERLTGSK